MGRRLEQQRPKLIAFDIALLVIKVDLFFCVLKFLMEYLFKTIDQDSLNRVVPGFGSKSLNEISRFEQPVVVNHVDLSQEQLIFKVP